MNDMWWALNREHDLNKIRKSTHQFITDLESKITELEENPDKLITEIKKAVEKFKKEIED